ncbi:MAG: 4-hydroxythreonine-4-phosphate dehydrogenase PdxA [Treponema sp.]|jgi:4-hydroxy-L-threonine phosphate dehydrogenase PdxA|nr:4-hydroxythreonine-4-phosphate dehydrogenase PdxA [Treponema sp.]
MSVSVDRNARPLLGVAIGDTVGIGHEVIAMYHDQSHIALKKVGFRNCECAPDAPNISGINVPLESSVICCSVDHGTAFDRAGKGTADPGSMATATMPAGKMKKARSDVGETPHKE